MGEGSNTCVCFIVKGQRSFVKVKPLEAKRVSSPIIILKVKCVQFFLSSFLSINYPFLSLCS